MQAEPLEARLAEQRNAATSAQYFHLLRRQMVRPFRHPLIVMSPKSLLRHPECVSPQEDFIGDTRFQELLDDPDRDDDQWLYLPALRKTKRIASSDKSGSFMGSDFNYSDMTSRNLGEYLVVGDTGYVYRGWCGAYWYGWPVTYGYHRVYYPAVGRWFSPYSVGGVVRRTRRRTRRRHLHCRRFRSRQSSILPSKLTSRT